MKIALVQQNYSIGDFSGNSRKMLEAVEYAALGGAEMVVFPDGALTGSPLMGLVDYEDFRKRTYSAINDFAETVPKNIDIVFGIREAIPEAERCLVCICGGEVNCLADKRISRDGNEVVLNTKSIPFSHRVAGQVFTDGSRIASKENVIMVKVNQCGASTDTIYYGGSYLCMPDGRSCKLPLFKEHIEVIDTESMGHEDLDWGDKTSQVNQALVMGIKDYFAKNGFKEACIALSGGIDSAVVVALAVQALGAANVRVLMLPSGFSTSHSVDDSQEMVRRLGIRSDLISIAPVFDTTIKALEPIFAGTSFGLAEENIQARLRCVLTMALSNKTGALMLNTSNKSEVAVGYGTLYGDTSGALGIIGDLYKTEVYELAEYINLNYGDPIPRSIIEKAPSAELRPDQKDSDSLPEYNILDAILYRLVELEMPLGEVIGEGFDPVEVEKVARMVWVGDFKRKQCPPVLRVSGVTFGVERVFPITKSKF